jgi:hypothetical protein
MCVCNGFAGVDVAAGVETKGKERKGGRGGWGAAKAGTVAHTRFRLPIIGRKEGEEVKE